MKISTVIASWSLMRVLRLAMGIFMMFEAYRSFSWAPALLGGILLFQAYSNSGCCGSGNCAVPPHGKSENT
jgi:hypothetical protein